MVGGGGGGLGGVWLGVGVGCGFTLWRKGNEGRLVEVSKVLYLLKNKLKCFLSVIDSSPNSMLS